MSEQWNDMIAQATSLRRELHRLPELTWEEVGTAKSIREYLTSLDIPWRECANTGTVAQINPDGKPNDKKAPHIALRGDIDALPIEESSGVDWSSKNVGCMHACGHDGHTATLMGTARWLKLHEAKMPGAVTLLFQPAEEGGHGAREMINDGALEGVDQIFGWHNWPAIPFGKLICPDGIVMCGNGTFTITVNGEGGHASQPELCRDPVLAASAITMALQQIVSRRLPPQQTAVVSVTSIEAPSGSTIIPAKAVIGGSIRISNKETGDQVNQLIREISEATARSYGVECDVDIQPRYNATINHSQQALAVRNSWQSLFGESAMDTETAIPIMASEDFSYYLQEVPGAFALIGSNDGERKHQVPCHSSYYDFNDDLISKVVQLYAHLVGAPLP